MVANQSKRGINSVNGLPSKRPKVECDSCAISESSSILKIPVDRYCTEQLDSTHVYREGHDIYDVMLNQTNLQHNNNKFYVIQLLEDNDKPHFYVWFRWGRVGKVGQSKLESFGKDFVAAKNCFMQKFLSKTCNNWDERADFRKVNGKYDLVKLEYSQIEKPENGSAPLVESSLPQTIQALLQLICDVKAMEEAMTGMQYDTRRAPLGKLTKEQVKAGYLALNKVSACIAALNPDVSDSNHPVKSGRRARSSSTSRLDKQNYEKSLLAACNEFYTRIPHDFGMRIPPLIRTTEAVKEKLELLNALDDIQFAMDAIKHSGIPTEHVLDSQYRQLDCEIVHLDSSDPTYQILVDYLMTNCGPTHTWYTLELLDVFTCSKPGESRQFEDHGNRLLLWHGSRLTNWFGILGRGLQVAPAEAPVTGYMFGKGIYFADCSTKSANYAYPTASKNVGLVALCEVSLGKSQLYYEACSTANKLPDGYHSVKGVGKMVPPETTWKTLPDGVRVPVGTLLFSDEARAQTATLQFNEYVVYDPKQVRLRYLMKVKFNFH